MRAFRIVLALHAPLILPEVVPRLDTLLQEAACRLYRDWDREHELPLVFDEALGLYRCSQLIMATTPATSIWPVNYSRRADGRGLDRAEVSMTPRPFRTIGGKFMEKFTSYAAYWPPYVAFDAAGDANRCAELLQLLDGMGREHAGGMGRFEVAGIRAGHEHGWQKRSLPASFTPHWIGTHDALHSFERLTVWGKQRPIIRPPRIIREVLAREVGHG